VNGFQLRAVLTPRGHSAFSGFIFGCHHRKGGSRDVNGIQWVDVRNATKHLTVLKRDTTTKNGLAQMSIIPQLRNSCQASKCKHKEGTDQDWFVYSELGILPSIW
jgi:hypothetical protein